MGQFDKSESSKETVRKLTRVGRKRVSSVGWYEPWHKSVYNTVGSRTSVPVVGESLSCIVTKPDQFKNREDEERD